MPLPYFGLPRFRLRTLMIAVAVVALHLGLLTTPIGEMPVLFFIGPVIGAVIHRYRGGRGILGGVIGGVGETWVFGTVMYVRAYFFPLPNTVDYLGPVLSFTLLTCEGIAIGGIVGLFVWVTAGLVAARGGEANTPPS